ncbi:MAG: hypothetical protein QOE83_39 [Actinomycetota bacterium]|jgi:hypothetical protein|nr:hypothetical protein [Actinomycetota bacterium]
MNDREVNAEGRPVRAISKRQREAIEWLASGRTVDQVANLIHVSPALVSRWKREDLLFRVVLETRKSDPSPAQVDLLDLVVQMLDRPDQGQPWSSEQSEED